MERIRRYGKDMKIWKGIKDMERNRGYEKE